MINGDLGIWGRKPTLRLSFRMGLLISIVLSLEDGINVGTIGINKLKPLILGAFSFI